MRLAEPGRICAVVTPPATAHGIWGSWGQYPSRARTYAVFGATASLPSLWARSPGDA